MASSRCSLAQRDSAITELLDGDALDDPSLRANLGDIRRINAILGWTAFTARAVVRAAQDESLRRFRLLDVCSGSADIPLAIVRLAARRGLQASVTATDLSPQIVRIAAEQARVAPDMIVEQQDALHLPYPDHAFDIGLCTLALHHFAPDLAGELLRQLARVARTVLIFDVERHPLALAGAWLLTRALPMHAMTRHDALASVRRAYRAAEVQAMAREHGIAAAVSVAFPFRLVLQATSVPRAHANA